jgi:threonyl-tRNA synthetase
MQKVPYMLVIGKREVEQNAVAVRLRSGEDLGAMQVPDFVDMVEAVVAAKSLELKLGE